MNEGQEGGWHCTPRATQAGASGRKGKRQQQQEQQQRACYKGEVARKKTLERTSLGSDCMDRMQVQGVAGGVCHADFGGSAALARSLPLICACRLAWRGKVNLSLRVSRLGGCWFSLGHAPARLAHCPPSGPGRSRRGDLVALVVVSTVIIAGGLGPGRSVQASGVQRHRQFASRNNNLRSARPVAFSRASLVREWCVAPWRIRPISDAIRMRSLAVSSRLPASRSSNGSAASVHLSLVTVEGWAHQHTRSPAGTGWHASSSEAGAAGAAAGPSVVSPPALLICCWCRRRTARDTQRHVCPFSSTPGAGAHRRRHAAQSVCSVYSVRQSPLPPCARYSYRPRSKGQGLRALSRAYCARPGRACCSVVPANHQAGQLKTRPRPVRVAAALGGPSRSEQPFGLDRSMDACSGSGVDEGEVVVAVW